MNSTISVCVIVKNEEKQIRGLLENVVDFADEVIIVDTGSADKTKEMIQSYISDEPRTNIRLLDHQSVGGFHFGKAKNFSIQNATKDYIIVLDADERLSNEFKSKVRKFLSELEPVVANVIRKDEILPHLIDYPERIIKRDSRIMYGVDDQSKVHEQLSHNIETKSFPEVVWHQQRENHYIIRPQRIFLQLELQIDRVPKTKSFIGHVMRGVWYFCHRFKKIYFTRRLCKDGLKGFKYAFMRSLDAFLVELFVGLRSSKIKTWGK